jgi:5-formaminoimidazole-4-carboxamide-1-beta-D-ribofuranosyl 5'-monophosphate synthetase
MLMVGQEENYMNSEYNIYPNPSNGKFCLETQNLTTEPIEIMVMDLTGRQVYEENAVVTGKKEIDLTVQEKGMYFLKLKSGDRIFVGKLLIR